MAKVIRRPGPGEAKLEAMLREMENAHVRVGWLETAVYENGATMAYVATIHENGVPEKKIPPRPMLKPTVDDNEAAWAQTARILADKVVKGKLSVRKLMEQLGALAAGNLRTTIGEVMNPPLAKKTIEARQRKKERGEPIGSLTKPLQETDLLHTSVQHKVADGKPPAEWSGS